MKTNLDNKNIELIEGKNDNGNGCMMDKTMTNSPCSNQPYQNSNNNPPYIQKRPSRTNFVGGKSVNHIGI